MNLDLFSPAPCGSESAYTPSMPPCPHPEHWHAPDNGTTEIEVSLFVAGLVRVLQPEFVIETGSGLGQTTEVMGKALVANGHGSLVGLETNPNLVKTAQTRCAGLPVSIVQCPALAYTPPQPVQFAWFDSGSIPERCLEFRRYYPWLQGIVAFHDSAPHHPLRPGLEQLAKDGLARFIYLPTPRGVALVEVLH